MCLPPHHFGVYGVAFDKSRQRVLVIQKTRGPYKGRYDLPGGRPEENESNEETLRREVYEETGLAATNPIPIQTLHFSFSYEKDGASQIFHHQAALFHIHVIGNLKTNGDGEDSDGACFYPLDELTEKNSSPALYWAAQNMRQG